MKEATCAPPVRNLSFQLYAPRDGKAPEISVRHLPTFCTSSRPIPIAENSDSFTGFRFLKGGPKLAKGDLLQPRVVFKRESAT